MSRWTDIPGWDLPSPENTRRCKSFLKSSFSYNGIENGLRYFQNPSGREGLPLVIFLHGADACGSDNESQISLHDVATVFADEAWQSEHPCHIVAPQYKKGKHWAFPSMLEYVYELTLSYAELFHADKSRLYVYGYSAGAIGIFSFLKRYQIFAAAIPICGATDDTEMEKLTDTPMWLYHAGDDPMVHPDEFEIVYYKETHIGSDVIYDKMSKLGHRNIHYTRIPEGKMRRDYHLYPHCSWVLMGEDTEAKRWLFQQRSSYRADMIQTGD
ncbi:MAG: hypothetical protein J5819_11185 [Eubacterium sp.]|nr:hypothetical protein [Eubacterium sp.]